MRILLNPSPYDEKLAACDLTKVSVFLINEIEGEQMAGEKEPDKRSRSPFSKLFKTSSTYSFVI